MRKPTPVPRPSSARSGWRWASVAEVREYGHRPSLSGRDRADDGPAAPRRPAAIRRRSHPTSAASQTSPIASRSVAKAAATRPRSIRTRARPRRGEQVRQGEEELQRDDPTPARSPTLTPSQRLPSSRGIDCARRAASAAPVRRGARRSSPRSRMAAASNAGYRKPIVPSGSRPASRAKAAIPMRSGLWASSYNVLWPLSRSTTPNRCSGEKNTADAMSVVLPTCPTMRTSPRLPSAQPRPYRPGSPRPIAATPCCISASRTPRGSVDRRGFRRRPARRRIVRGRRRWP